jgi:hypothetical protein
MSTIFNDSQNKYQHNLHSPPDSRGNAISVVLWIILSAIAPVEHSPVHKSLLSSVGLNAAIVTSWVILQTSVMVFIPISGQVSQINPSPALFLDLHLVHSVPIAKWWVTLRRTAII